MNGLVWLTLTCTRPMNVANIDIKSTLFGFRDQFLCLGRCFASSPFTAYHVFSHALSTLESTSMSTSIIAFNQSGVPYRASFCMPATINRTRRSARSTYAGCARPCSACKGQTLRGFGTRSYRRWCYLGARPLCLNIPKKH